MSAPPQRPSAPAPDASEIDNEERPKLGISTAQVMGSALAAVSGALFASIAGTTGTLVGAALGSIIATVGSAWYTYSLKKGTTTLKKGTLAVVQGVAQVRGQTTTTPAQPQDRPTGDDRPDDEDTTTTTMAAVTQADLDAADAAESHETESGAAADESGEEDGERRHDWKGSFKMLPWRRLAVASAVVLVIGIGLITLIETVTGKPLSGDRDSGTTISRITDRNGSNDQTPTQTPTQSDQPTTDDNDGDNDGNGTDGATEGPTSEPTDNPTDPTTTPTDPTTSSSPTTTPSGPTDDTTEGAPNPSGSPIPEQAEDRPVERTSDSQQ